MHLSTEHPLHLDLPNVLQVCERDQIATVLQAPSIHDIEQWQGAAIASTSRLLLPVHEVIYSGKAGTSCKTFEYNENSLMSRLESLVLDEVAGRSEPLQ